MFFTVNFSLGSGNLTFLFSIVEFFPPFCCWPQSMKSDFVKFMRQLSLFRMRRRMIKYFNVIGNRIWIWGLSTHNQLTWRTPRNKKNEDSGGGGMVVDRKMEALKELGIPGPEVLQDSLTNCTVPPTYTPASWSPWYSPMGFPYFGSGRNERKVTAEDRRAWEERRHRWATEGKRNQVWRTFGKIFPGRSCSLPVTDRYGSFEELGSSWWQVFGAHCGQVFVWKLWCCGEEANLVRALRGVWRWNFSASEPVH